MARKVISGAGLGVIDGVANLKWNWDNGTDGTTLDISAFINRYVGTLRLWGLHPLQELDRVRPRRTHRHASASL